MDGHHISAPVDKKLAQQIHKKKVKQFEEHKYYPDYEHHKKISAYTSKPKVTEFYKPLLASQQILSQGIDGLQRIYKILLEDFFKTKNENFPAWPGLPDIKVEPRTALQEVGIGWYAAVPDEYVINPEDRLEEELWRS